jgi:EmrB/QacA subfamily drug resistance transporter
MTAVGDLFPPRERGKWTGVMMSIFGFSSVIGPLLGGYLIEHLDWHWLFWIFLPIGFIAFALIWSMFPKVTSNERQRVDYLGSLFMTTTIVPLLLAFSWAGTQYAWTSPQILGLLAATVVSAAVFVLVERKAANPILPMHLFRNNVVTISNIIGFIMNFGMMGAMIYISFFVQGVIGISPTYAGYVTMPMSIVMVIASTLTGQWMAKSGKYKRYALIGIPIMIAGMTLMVFMHNVEMAVAAMIVFGFGLGLGMPVFSLATQNAVSHKELGAVTASTQLFRNLGGTIGIAVMGTVMSNNLTTNLKESLQSSAPELAKVDPKTAEQMLAFANPQTLMNTPLLEKTQESLPAGAQQVFIHMIDNIREALSTTLSTVFLTATLVMVVSFILVFFLKEIPLRTSNQEVEKKEDHTSSNALATELS